MRFLHICIQLAVFLVLVETCLPIRKVHETKRISFSQFSYPDSIRENFFAYLLIKHFTNLANPHTKCIISVEIAFNEHVVNIDTNNSIICFVTGIM